jgi:hypothetical protein
MGHKNKNEIKYRVVRCIAIHYTDKFLTGQRNKGEFTGLAYSLYSK